MISSKSGGFTLIEVMVTVLIISILSAIAIPAYTDYVIRARIMEAISGLSSRQTRMEQCFQDNHTYALSACAAACNAVDAAGLRNDAFFTFSCTTDQDTFTLTATGVRQMTGFVYTVNQADAKSTTGVPSGWAANTTCWVTRKGGTC
jgi:type IV pilus assembly protein PilE